MLEAQQRTRAQGISTVRGLREKTVDINGQGA